MDLKAKLPDAGETVLLYGTTPPRLGTSPENVALAAEKLATRLANLPLDGVVLYDIQDETGRTELPRPFPFVGTIDPASGLFTPNVDGPNPQRKGERNNIGDVWVVATYTPPGASAPLRGRSHLLVSPPLAPLGVWPPERITSAMEGSGPPLAVRLSQPIPVVLFYTTAIVTSEGATRFAQDIYGHDAALDRALRSLRPARPPLD